MNGRTIVLFTLTALLVLSSGGPLVGIALGQETEASGDVSGPTRELVDSIRDDLVEMRFEKALAAIEALLGQPGLTEAERSEALILRSQAHGAFGDFNAVETDYRKILALHPTYLPEASLTPAKAMERFNKVKAAMIGTVKISIEPPDARVFVDGVEVKADPSGEVLLLAGSHTLRAEHGGHDPLEELIEVSANKETSLRLELVPNARNVVLRTEPDGVEVMLDGEPVGRTERPPDLVGAGAPAAELVIENVPLGEHVFELSRECYRSERVSDSLAVDLLDRSPKRYQVVRMTPVRARLILNEGPAGGEVRIDGKPAARLPLAEPIETCPGSREIEVALGGRVVWRQTTELGEADQATVKIVPRPSVALVGADVWPRALSEFGSSFNIVGRVGLPERVDLSVAKGWTEVELQPDVDLAFAVVPSRRQGASDRWYLYSPILREVVALDSPPDVERPRWTTVTWGLATVDDDERVSTIVAEVSEGSPVAKAGIAAGDRIVSLGELEVTDTAQLQQVLSQTGAGETVKIEWSTVDGESRVAGLTGKPGPMVMRRVGRRDLALVQAAWAAVDALVDPHLAPSARANLGLLFLDFGHHELAVDTWKRVDWGDRPGVGEGTRQYYLGRALELEGREEEATEAYRKAADSRSTAFHDDGPPIAPAARDRLADLGVVLTE